MAAVIDSKHFRSKAAASHGSGGEGGGMMEDILKRLGVLESSVGETRADVSAIKATLPSLATKAELAEARRSLEGMIGDVRTSLEGKVGDARTSLEKNFGKLWASLEARSGSLEAKMNTMGGALEAKMNAMGGALEAKMNAMGGALEAKINATETRIIRWMIGTAIAALALAFGIARYLA